MGYTENKAQLEREYMRTVAPEAGILIAPHGSLWDAITYSCLWYLLLAPKSSCMLMILIVLYFVVAMLWFLLRWCDLFTYILWVACLAWSQIAKFMGPTWGPSGSCWPQMGPMWPHEPCIRDFTLAWFQWSNLERYGSNRLGPFLPT